jgi:ADP-L-glycero-D-manno-heptose 6-epimerase
MTVPSYRQPWPFKRALVTGGAGFIGSALVWALNREGFDRVLIADRLGTDEKWRNLVPLQFEDYIDADDLLAKLDARALAGVDVILHLGACSSTTERDASFLMRNNFEFTKQLAAWALAHGVRFVYASSAATYGDGTAGMSDGHKFLREFATLRPLNGYGYSKHLFDQYAARTGQLDRITGLKFFNIFGPNESHKGDMRSLVNKAYHEVLRDGCVRLFKSYRPDYADGEQERDFLYVKDAVQMTLALAKNPTATGIYNVGSGVATTWLTLARALFRALDREPAIEFIEMPESLRGKYQYHTCADIGKLRRSGYAERITPVEDAVEDYVRLYLAGDRRLGDVLGS